MRPARVVQVVRRVARCHGLSVVEVTGRGKGSHRLYALLDEDGIQVGRFTVPQHPRELSWVVLRSIETGLASLLGEMWMETDR